MAGTGETGNMLPSVIAFDWQNSPSQTMPVRRESDDSLRCSTTPAVLRLDGEGNTAAELSGALSAHHSSHNRGAICTTGDTTHALTAEGHDASEDGTGRGTPIVLASGQANAEIVSDGDPSLTAGSEQPIVFAAEPIIGTLDAREHGGGFLGSDGAMQGHVQVSAGAPRRLMPIECERLMSWPDGFTQVPDENGRPMSDTARYRMCGNGVVSNVAEWIGQRLQAIHAATLNARGAA